MLRTTATASAFVTVLPWLVHAVPAHTGCGSTRWIPGSTVSETITDQGRERVFNVFVPNGYEPDTRTPIVLYFHGWGGNGNLNWMTNEANSATFIAVGPTGVGGGANPDGGANSWNGGGSTTSSGGFGPPDASCAEGSPQYCYDSCAARPQGCHPCDWTTCNDDISFTDALLDWLEEELCVDPARVFVTGHSNGGQFAWAVAARLANRIAATVPSAGTPHAAFGEGPVSRPVSVMDVHGKFDTICPANWTDPSTDGWYYEMVPIMCTLWSEADGCQPTLEHYPMSLDHQNGLYCIKQGKCEEGIDVVRCAWEGGHGMYNNLATIMWEFFAAHPMSPERLLHRFADGKADGH